LRRDDDAAILVFGPTKSGQRCRVRSSTIGFGLQTCALQTPSLERRCGLRRSNKRSRHSMSSQWTEEVLSPPALHLSKAPSHGKAGPVGENDAPALYLGGIRNVRATLKNRSRQPDRKGRQTMEGETIRWPVFLMRVTWPRYVRCKCCKACTRTSPRWRAKSLGGGASGGERGNRDARGQAVGDCLLVKVGRPCGVFTINGYDQP